MVEPGETPRRLIRKRCRYSSLGKFEDIFDTALYLLQKTLAFQDKWQSGKSARNPAIGERSCATLVNPAIVEITV